MMRFLMPLLLVGSAIALFVLYTDKTYQADKELKAQVAAYDNALNKSQELKRVRDQLLSKRNALRTGDIQKLEKVLPDNVDNIRLIIDINNIAARHGLTLRNVELGQVSSRSGTESALSVGPSGEPVGSVELGFAVAATYDGLLAFLQDVEHSQRVVDVERLTFDVNDETLISDYAFTVRTYWLR